jgi:hypothetical protein
MKSPTLQPHFRQILSFNGQFKFEVQQHLTDRRIPHVASDNQVIFLGGHLLDPLLLLLARV